MACQKVYRDTTLGKLLQETLDELTEEVRLITFVQIVFPHYYLLFIVLQDDQMTPDLAMEALAEFDSSMKKALADHHKNKNKVVYNFKVLKKLSTSDV